MENHHAAIQKQLAEKHNTWDYARLSHFLLEEQREEWPLAAKNYKGLASVKVKRFAFDHFNIFAQFNPERIRSSAAKVDKKSIEERPCFLCEKNLPAEQKALLFNEAYLILVNPFPIFQEHFTIPHLEHKPQRIKGNFRPMLDLSKAMHHYIVFYNGPKCGASAPDHFHFQAGIKGFMPIDYEYAALKPGFSTLFASDELNIYSADKYIRHFIALEGNDPEKLTRAFNILYDKLAEQPHEEEPMMNILAGYWDDHWRILVFPRKKHRPGQYYKEGDENILISPASVDFGGTLITPLEKDFEKLGQADIKDIFEQVTISSEDHLVLSGDLKATFSSALAD